MWLSSKSCNPAMGARHRQLDRIGHCCLISVCFRSVSRLLDPVDLLVSGALTTLGSVQNIRLNVSKMDIFIAVFRYFHAI